MGESLNCGSAWERAKGATRTAADDSVYARLEKDLTAVKNDVAHLSQQISEAVNALGAAAQRQARRGLRNAGQSVVSLIAAAPDRAVTVENAARGAAFPVGGIMPDSIFGGPRQRKPRTASAPPGGHWSEYSTVSEHDFKFAAAAKRAITQGDISLSVRMLSKGGAYLVLARLEGSSGRRNQTHDRDTLLPARLL